MQTKEGEFESVKLWEEPLVIPTYNVLPADVNPIFYRPELYQFASKFIYPYPLMNNLSNHREDKTYKAVYIENEYIKLCILPEMGGKLFYATDKTNGYEIFYRQHVIKPSNIGMSGAWISGGVEWCTFHHHRPSTFMPADYTLTENKDGSKTVWVGEIEHIQRMKWIVGITLYPGKSYIETQVKMLNRTENPHSFLYWANVATHANDDYQVIFPPSTSYATFHTKDSFMHWPITEEVYTGRDCYKNHIDASWWKNHPYPNSFFAFDLKEDFSGGYDHGKKAGTLHIGNHHIVVGSKLWEWGTAGEGKMWDEVLTDEDGPYAELMVGAYSDNQPDFSWIKPYEVKHFKQYWYPLREIGLVKNANLQAAVNLELVNDNVAKLIVNTTERLQSAKLLLKAKGDVVIEKKFDIDPANPFCQELTLPKGTKETDLEAALYTQENEKLISYRPVKKDYNPDLPPVYEAPHKPEDIKTVEELYLAGLRIKQFYNPLLNAFEYFDEALRRDPGDSRCNVQVGLEYKKKGMYEEAEEKFRTALKRLSHNYTPPRDCEAYYNLGLVLKAQGKYEDAYDNLYRSTWDYSFHAAAYYHLAEISCLGGDYIKALEEINLSLTTNSVNTKALNLKCIILRKLEKNEEAEMFVVQIFDIDLLNHWARNELYLLKKKESLEEQAARQLTELKEIMRDYPQSYIELATDYMHGGFWEEAIEILTCAVKIGKKGISDYPIISYYLGYLYLKKGEQHQANQYFQAASKMSTDYCFPFRLETIDVLKAAFENNPNDARAHYFLGTLLYDLQPGNAIKEWEKSVELEESLAIAHRNLGWGYYYTENNLPKALVSYEKAIQYNTKDSLYYGEIDILHEKNRSPIAKRLKLLDKNHEYLEKRADALCREIIVRIQSGDYDKAVEYLANYYFHVTEDDHHNYPLHEVYVDAYLLRGKTYLKQGECAKALQDFLKADEYPANHQIGRNPHYIRYPQIDYFVGTAYQAIGNKEEAQKYFNKAVAQNIGESEYMYYQAMAYQKLGQDRKAKEIFDELVKIGENKLEITITTDYSHKFEGDYLKRVDMASAYFFKAMGYSGNKLSAQAEEAFKKTIEFNGGHVWANDFLLNIESTLKRSCSKG